MTHPFRICRRAFTLIELLAVVSIITVLAALIAPVAMKLLSGTQINQGIDLIVGQVKYARQVAMSENRPVEIRLYKFIDPRSPGSKSEIRALQLWRMKDDGGWKAIDKIQRFPGRVVVSSDTTTELGPDLTPKASDPVSVLPKEYVYKAFHFRPDGSASVSAGANFFTIRNENDPGEPPANFAAVQVEPLSGAVRLFRR